MFELCHLTASHERLIFIFKSDLCDLMYVHAVPWQVLVQWAVALSGALSTWLDLVALEVFSNWNDSMNQQVKSLTK